MNTRLSKLLLSGVLIAALALPTLVLSPARAQDGSEPYWPTEGWRTSTPEEQGMDSQKLGKFLDMAALGDGFHSALVIRNGYVVLDASVPPYQSDDPHYLASVTKVLISTLLGIAIDQGYIEGVEQSIWDFFDKDGTANMDDRKAAITIKNLLTQTSGFDFEFGGDWFEFSGLTAEDQSWVQFILDRAMATEPGTTFNYMDGNPLLVSAIIGQTTGMSADEFAQKNLFEPLGMGEVLWLSDPQGVSQGGDRCFISPYDMAKLGYLYLHHGEWDGQQIVPAEWIDEATANYIKPHYWEGYGYYWYSGSYGRGEAAPRGYSALGMGGQEIWVIPDLELVVVLTGELAFQGLNHISSFITPAVVSDTALPANSEANAELQAKADALANPSPTATAPLPDMAAQVSNAVYALTENDLGWQTASFNFGEQEASLTLELPDRTVVLPIGLDGVSRLSSTGLPAEPILRPVDNLPLASQGAWTSDTTFVFSSRDTLGLVDADFRVTFGDMMYIVVSPNMGFVTSPTIRGDRQ